MADQSACAPVSLKLLINTQTKQVLFAEAGNDFVDFLFCILSLPVAKVISLVHKQGMAGSLSNLYESVVNLNETYMQPNQDKTTLLTPPPAGASRGGVPLLAIDGTPEAPKKSYKCPNCHNNNFSGDRRATCPSCRRQMTCEMSYVAPPAQLEVSTGEGGFVKGVVTYMVMDDLVVKPMSTISSITVLNKFSITNVGVLEEKVVDFGMNEAEKLLKASLETKNVLTSVFLS